MQNSVFRLVGVDAGFFPSWSFSSSRPVRAVFALVGAHAEFRIHACRRSYEVGPFFLFPPGTQDCLVILIMHLFLLGVKTPTQHSISQKVCRIQILEILLRNRMFCLRFFVWKRAYFRKVGFVSGRMFTLVRVHAEFRIQACRR